jgi:hypothetical protein
MGQQLQQMQTQALRINLVKFEATQTIQASYSHPDGHLRE